MKKNKFTKDRLKEVKNILENVMILFSKNDIIYKIIRKKDF